MTHNDQFFPWCIVRHLPSSQSVIVGRFRRRNEAEAQIQLIQRMNPDAIYTVVFDSQSSPPKF